MEPRDLALLASSPLFRGIDVRELAPAVASVPHRVRGFPEGSLVIAAGSSYDELLVLLEGEVGAEMTNHEGKSFLVETIKAPEAVATAVLFAPRPVLPVAVVARRDLRLAAFPRDAMLDLASRCRPLLRNLMADMGDRLATLAERLRAVQFATLKERLADWMLRRAALSGALDPKDGRPPAIRLDASKERLASLFGVARPSLSRELGELQRKGLIRVEGRTIVLLDPAALRLLAGS